MNGIHLTIQSQINWNLEMINELSDYMADFEEQEKELVTEKDVNEKILKYLIH